MKSIFVIAFLLILRSATFSQDVYQNFIKEAQDFYAQKNYKQAQMSLQDAINELNKLMSDQLGTILPDEINGLKGEPSVSSSASLGMVGGGLQLTKKYKHPAKSGNEAEVQIMANSPMLSAMNMYMNNPAMMGEGAKSVRVGTLRAILKSEMLDHYSDDNSGTTTKMRSTQIQMPLGQTLVTFELKGFATEQDELAFAAKIDTQKIKMAVGE